MSLEWYELVVFNRDREPRVIDRATNLRVAERRANDVWALKKDTPGSIHQSINIHVFHRGELVETFQAPRSRRREQKRRQAA